MAISRQDKKTPGKSEEDRKFGIPGVPINRTHPFYFGFLVTTGGVVALTVLRSLAAASQIFVLIIIALFFAMGLNPAVEALRRRGLGRTNAVALIFACVTIFTVLFAWLVIPPVVSQGAYLINHAPALLSDLKTNSTIASFNDQFGVIDTLQKKLGEKSQTHLTH